MEREKLRKRLQSYNKVPLQKMCNAAGFHVSVSDQKKHLPKADLIDRILSTVKPEFVEQILNRYDRDPRLLAEDIKNDPGLSNLKEEGEEDEGARPHETSAARPTDPGVENTPLSPVKQIVKAIEKKGKNKEKSNQDFQKLAKKLLYHTNAKRLAEAAIEKITNTTHSTKEALAKGEQEERRALDEESHHLRIRHDQELRQAAPPPIAAELAEAKLRKSKQKVLDDAHESEAQFKKITRKNVGKIDDKVKVEVDATVKPTVKLSEITKQLRNADDRRFKLKHAKITYHRLGAIVANATDYL